MNFASYGNCNLQLFNFSKLGINSENIHVLVGYNSKKGLSKEFENFINQNKQASFFVYPENIHALCDDQLLHHKI